MGSQTDYIMLGFYVIVIFTFALMGGWLWLRDEPIATNKLSWHQIMANTFHVSLIDEEMKHWILNIFYNEKISSPTYTVKGENKLSIQLPPDTSFKEYLDFIKTIDDVHDNLKALAFGVYEESILGKLKFTKTDLSTYREFKRNLLIRVLIRR